MGTKINLGAKAKIAVMQVGETKAHVQQNSLDQRELLMLHRPDEPPNKPDPSHSGVFGNAPDQRLIAELIAESVKEIYPAR